MNEQDWYELGCSDDACFIIDIIRSRIRLYEYVMQKGKCSPNSFDEMSIKKWALKQLLNDISDVDVYLSISEIRAILQITMDDYARFYNNSRNNKNNLLESSTYKYFYALEVIREVYDLTPCYIMED